MKRTEFVRNLISQELDEETLIQKVIEGSANDGVTPIKGETPAKLRAFAKLQIGKQRKQKAKTE